MDNKIGKLNITFGWSWLLVGLFLGMWMGLSAGAPDWLGGYTSITRRLLRLAHICFVAISLINILYGLFIDSIPLSTGIKKTGSYAIIVAAVFLPSVCLLAIADPFFEIFFVIPALAFVGAIMIMAWGHLKKVGP